MSEEKDIVERLLDPDFSGPMQHLRDWAEIDWMHAEATSEITRLRGEVERLRAANKLWVPTTEHQPSVAFAVPSADLSKLSEGE